MNQENIPMAKPIETQATQKPPETASGRAMAALILGILSIVCMGFLTGIPAIIMGQMELKAVKQGQAPKAGEGVAKVGFILGIVGTVLTCLMALAMIALIALGVSLGNMEALQNAAISI